MYLNHLKTHFPHLVPVNLLSSGPAAAIPRQSGGAAITTRTLDSNLELLNQISEMKSMLSEVKCANYELKMELCDLKLQHGVVKGQMIELKNEVGDLRALLRQKKGKDGGSCNKGAIIVAGVVILISVIVVFLFGVGK